MTFYERLTWTGVSLSETLKRSPRQYTHADIRRYLWSDQPVPIPPSVRKAALSIARRHVRLVLQAWTELQQEMAERKTQPEKKPFPERHPNRKYSGTQVRHIIQGLQAGKRQADVAREVGVPVCFVHSIVEAGRIDSVHRSLSPDRVGAWWSRLLKRADLEDQPLIPKLVDGRESVLRRRERIARSIA